MKKYRIFKEIEVLALAAILAAPVNVLASEPETNPVTDEQPSTTEQSVTEISEHKEPVVSVIFPSLPEEGESPLDFLIDPEQLIYLTDAAAYGGGRVDSGATILFRNHDRDYDFSRYSDRFEVLNQSEVPVKVTVTAQITNLGEIEMVGSPYTWDEEACQMYMAVVDNEGHERPLIEDGTVKIEVEMAEVDQYSFGLVGHCNPLGRWQEIYVGPRVTLTWDMEPIIPEELETPEIEIYNEILETEPYEEIEEPGEPESEQEPELEPTQTTEEEQQESSQDSQTDTTTEPSSDNTQSTQDDEPPPPDDSSEPGPPSDD